MLKSEAKSIGKVIAKILKNLADKDGIVVLNLGSQVKAFTNLQQPYIYKFIFQKLENDYKVKIINVDLQQSPGVDITMDLTQESGYDLLSSYSPDIILISNLLEHVDSINSVLTNLAKYLKGDYYIIVSGPRFFPYHADPIDNLFRPNKKELRSLFSQYGFLQLTHEYKYSLNIFFSTKNFQQALRDNLFSLKTLVSSPKMVFNRKFMERFSPVIVFISVFKQNFKI